MGFNRFVRLAAFGIGAFGLAGVAHAQAQNFPNKPVKFIITFTPGSATDVIGRIVAQKLADIWGQPVVPENRAGAGGSIASAFVAKLEPDGYTLMANSNAHTTNPAIYAKLTYDTLKDFTNVSPMVLAPNVLVVSPEGPFKKLMDLVDFAKSKPEALNFAHAGVGSGTHLNLEAFIAAAGIKVTQISYKGTPEAFTAVIGRSSDAFWSPIAASLSIIRGGKLNALAVSSAKRSPALPDVPSVADVGLPKAEAPGWFGIWAPAGMAPDLLNKINGDVRKALADPSVRERLVNIGADPLDMSPAEFTDFVRKEIQNSQTIIKAAGVKPQ